MATMKEIVIEKEGVFPICVKIVNKKSEVEEKYSLVKTKNDKYMLRK